MNFNFFLCIFVTFLFNLRISCASDLKGDLASEIIISYGQKHFFSWEYDQVNNKSIIQFTLEFKTSGYIGFGISPNGGMTDADIMIGGVGPDGQPYLKSYHGVGNTMPVEKTENWYLVKASENSTHTYLKVWRYLSACGEHDLEITKSTSSLIWALGANDEIHYHSMHRGAFSANLLDNPTVKNVSEYKVWTATQENMMPSDRETTYYCTVHKGPQTNGKKWHITGFGPILPSELAVAHTHHFVLYKCRLPKNTNTNADIFEKWVGKPGGRCHLPDAEQKLPRKECRLAIFLWGLGGKSFLFPQHVGYPIGESGDSEYYMLEIHYNNPEKQKLNFSSGVEFYYTDKIRKYDGEILTSGRTVSQTQMIPPNYKNFISTGHCAPQCIETLAPEGIKIFNVLLHAHTMARKITFRHFRKNEELPWILSDDKFDTRYQQNRQLENEVEVKPGDHLLLECTYDTTEQKQIVFGGESTGTEMCQTFTWYYPRAEIEYCTSNFPINKLLSDFGIKNITDEYKEEHSEKDPIILAPEQYKGLSLSEFFLTKPVWTKELKEKIQNQQRFEDQEYFCSSFKRGLTSSDGVTIKYPEFKQPYIPPVTPKVCKV